MAKIRMLRSVINGWTRERMEVGPVYEVPNEHAQVFVDGGHAEYVDEQSASVAAGSVDEQSASVAAGSVDEQAAVAEVVDLSSLAVPQLKEFAAERGIELSASRKADIIAEIEAALSTAGE